MPPLQFSLTSICTTAKCRFCSLQQYRNHSFSLRMTCCMRRQPPTIKLQLDTLRDRYAELKGLVDRCSNPVSAKSFHLPRVDSLLSPQIGKVYPCFRVKPRLRGPAQSGGDTSDQSDRTGGEMDSVNCNFSLNFVFKTNVYGNTRTAGLAGLACGATGTGAILAA